MNVYIETEGRWGGKRQKGRKLKEGNRRQWMYLTLMMYLKLSVRNPTL